ncbi:glutamine--fructose-6-phosphate transaminase (isomerizing) [Aeromicrobium sp. CTD01-1L150]|uniref:glutamine--fructose-6-phosphate transaminase (isomerizing) n=1 Tax=Aeromicrobium sp. CTD01-1L150 TaxID=3341830 RepID=UPI0035BF9C30
MCGIIACRTTRATAPHLVEALARLEYRGYDSAGIATAGGDGLVRRLRTTRRVNDLTRRLPAWEPRSDVGSGIGHTRWATHGTVSEANAHPHVDCSGRFAIVHNGILHNAADLRHELELAGHVLESEVDSEVVAHLVEDVVRRRPSADVVTATEEAVARLEGSWALVVLDAVTGQLVASAHRSPLVVARSGEDHFIASDAGCLDTWVEDYRVLEDGDIVAVGAGRDGQLWRREGRASASPSPIPQDVVPRANVVSLHPDFMSKEIHEQPDVVARLLDRWGRAAAGPDLWRSFGLPDPTRIAVLGCGTSLNAGRAVASVLGRVGALPHQSIVASEADESVIEPGTLIIALSQSGETADVLTALEVIAPQHPVVAITNNPHSALGRRADAVMGCQAGPEIGVAATKTYMSQLFAGWCLALSLLTATDRLDVGTARRLVDDLRRAPEVLSQAIGASVPAVSELVAGLTSSSGFLFLGRGTGALYAAEGALKLKELSYRWAESHPAGDLKHGPLALIEHGTPVVVVDPGGRRLAANISEVMARGAHVIRVGGFGAEIPALGVPESTSGIVGMDWCGPFESVVAMQLLARELATALGRDVDRPRNLAKSVTVE